MNYFEQNKKWLMPLMAGFMIAMSPVLLAVIDASKAQLLPKWYFVLVIALTGLSVGLGAQLTDTLSAKIVRFFGLALSLSVIALYIFG